MRTLTREMVEGLRDDGKCVPPDLTPENVDALCDAALAGLEAQTESPAQAAGISVETPALSGAGPDAGDPAVVWAWLPDLDEARENGDGMVEVLATAPRDGLGYMRLIEVPPSGLTESPVPPSDALQEGNHNGRKLKAGPATGDPCAEIAAAKELREIAEQIKQNLGARLPPDDYQFEYRCGVTLDFRDWKTVIATLLESRQEDAARTLRLVADCHSFGSDGQRDTILVRVPLELWDEVLSEAGRLDERDAAIAARKEQA